MRVLRENKAANDRLAKALPSDFQEYLVQDLEAKTEANVERQERARAAMAEARAAWQDARAAERATVTYNQRGVGQVGSKTIEAHQATRAAYRRYQNSKAEELASRVEAADLRLKMRRARMGLPDAVRVVAESVDKYGNPYAVDTDAARRADTVIRNAQRQDLAGGNLGHAVNVRLRREARRRQAAEAAREAENE